MAIQSAINNMLGTAGTVAAVSEHLAQEKGKNALEATKQLNEANIEAQGALEDEDKMKEAMDFTDTRIKELSDKTDLHQDANGRWRNKLNQFAKADQALQDELAGLRETRIRQENQMNLINQRKELVDKQLTDAKKNYNKYNRGGNQ